MAKKKKTEQEILAMQLCSCATVKEVIDSAVRFAFELHRKAEQEDACTVQTVASIILGCEVYCQTLIMMAGMRGQENGDFATRLVHDMRRFATAADNDCHDYIHKMTRREIAGNTLDKLSIDEMTLQ